MEKVRTKITNKTGLHARPASMFSEIANQYQADVTVIYKDKEVNGKSVMTIMSLGVSQGEEITIIVEGEDEIQAVTALTDLIESDFNE
ncbi:HPr family phosphocarrier protein [Sporohalobacter salinus]|uniref:HPr family phosphocarrier protein n=1 Tax=Sporohalobacter salinus TaxID=1494606 RepID=UPI00196163A5|nr:HPr family phosphocarrier protein [Sporohalobacter salinus]MBM7624172.1 phosphocarrier protein [Sporohalobacter salinus]